MKPGPLELIERKMIFSHQSVFIRTSLLKKYLFDLRYRFAADYNQLSILYLSGHSFCYVDITVALTPTDSGATYENYVSSTKEHFLILKGREYILGRKKNAFSALAGEECENNSSQFFTMSTIAKTGEI